MPTTKGVAAAPFVHPAHNREICQRLACTAGHMQPARALLSWPVSSGYPQLGA
jgi:hypothetical protein